jgi:hypothetical protein
MSSLLLDAEALYAELLAGVRMLLQPGSALVGIWSGGAWLAERLQRDLKIDGEHGVISSACTATTSARAAWRPAPTTRGCPSRSRAGTSC